MGRKERIEQKLSVLNPHFLEVSDKSHQHIGHMESAQQASETHFLIKIKADLPGKRTGLEGHRIINDLLKEEFASGLHALSVKMLG